MSRTRNAAPFYIPHAKSGRGRLQWYDATGARREKLLPGLFGSSESLAAKARLELEIATSPTAAPAPESGTGTEPLTVAELLSTYLDFAEKHYRGADGKPTSKLTEVKIVLCTVRELDAALPVTAFGPLKLKAVRQHWVANGIVRTECNARTGIAKRVFKWAVAEELAPPSVYYALAAVAGLQKGRTDAKESEPVLPVPDATVDATLPFLNRHVRGLIEFQRLTGCRPGEACQVRRCDLDTTDDIWVYRPRTHKMAHQGKKRPVPIGPRAQGLLKSFFTDDAEAYLFSPRRAVEEVRAERAANRKTPRYPSAKKRDAARRKAAPKRVPRERYGRNAYAQAVTRACEKAGVPHWHPNQLRHTFATAVRKAHGLEAAQVLLGHSRADVTQIYAERNESLAAQVAARMG